ncbi:HprK-related kinase A [Catenovulum agarivorans]|uniref:HprK-related kinase A n=1 Tax=Catenovulum agarivorans TaxID=1172192 RepID=UPI0002E4315A|nr:HprK-related kinase A [Catenovulum agarivorans]
MHNIVCGPFCFSIETSINSVVKAIGSLYTEQARESGEFVDFAIELTSPKSIRRIIKPQVNFSVDEHNPFKPLPLDHAYPMLEWGMNWCIATSAHQFLIVHAASIEKNGKVIMMPADSGSGKSTLTAFLVYNGWRLFSDELSLCSLDDGYMQPLARPINLKNQSIDIIKECLPSAIFSATAFDTHKGTVALLKAPDDSVKRMHETSPLSAIVFPKYIAGSETVLQECHSIAAFEMIIKQSFNYHILGDSAFRLVCKYLQQTPCYQLTYSKFDEANLALSELV